MTQPTAPNTRDNHITFDYTGRVAGDKAPVNGRTIVVCPICQRTAIATIFKKANRTEYTHREIKVEFEYEGKTYYALLYREYYCELDAGSGKIATFSSPLPD